MRKYTHYIEYRQLRIINSDESQRLIDCVSLRRTPSSGIDEADISFNLEKKRSQLYCSFHFLREKQPKQQTRIGNRCDNKYIIRKQFLT